MIPTSLDGRNVVCHMLAKGAIESQRVQTFSGD